VTVITLQILIKQFWQAKLIATKAPFICRAQINQWDDLR